MSQAWAYSLGSVVIISLLSLIGLSVIALHERLLHRLIPAMMSLAVGAMLGDAFLHLLPELYDKPHSDNRIALSILGGLILFYLLELAVRRHHTHRHPPAHDVELHTAHDLPASDHRVAPVGYVSLIAGSLHNVMDGVLIAASYMTSFKVGLATTIAILLHEVPHEIGGFGVLLHAGFTRAKALFFNFLTGCLSLAGVVASLLLGGLVEDLPSLTLPLTTGGFIYIAASSLLPELAKRTRLREIIVQLVGITLGVLVMLLLTFIE
ncbi:MAG: ZIP family metal transporter [Pyrinomonadaceae bacterium MAG19_C2-C3]|nr:ZIP family metal transporter [Pyrinomonadaceae bacterium MAG19_C2-C3]